MEKIYISGAITNNPNYKEQFEAKEKELKDKYIVLTPLCLPQEGLTWEEYMKVDLAILSVCDAIYMLKGWESSKGAKLEHNYALARQLKIIYEQE